VWITINVVSNFLFAVMLTVFILLEFERLMGLATKQLKDQPVFGVLPAMVSTAVSYIGIRTRLNLVVGVGVTILCLLFRIEYPFLWGIWAFVLSYVPYIGLIIAVTPPFLLVWANAGLPYAFAFLVSTFILNVSVENVLGPTYTGKKLQLSPAIVFASFFFWAWLLGPVGALLSMPITVLFMLIFSRYEGTQGLAMIMGQAEAEAE
jgi:AI-2 transport protein TqsA